MRVLTASVRVFGFNSSVITVSRPLEIGSTANSATYASFAAGSDAALESGGRQQKLAQSRVLTVPIGPISSFYHLTKY